MKITKIPSYIINQIEKSDSKTWLEYCLKDLSKALENYHNALKRYDKAWGTNKFNEAFK